MPIYYIYIFYYFIHEKQPLTISMYLKLFCFVQQVVEDAELSTMAENPDTARYDQDSDFTTKTYIEALLIGVEYVYVYQSCNAHKKKLSPDGQCVKCSDSVPPSTSPADWGGGEAAHSIHQRGESWVTSSVCPSILFLMPARMQNAPCLHG